MHCQGFKRKADAGEHLEMFSRVGLLLDEPPGGAGLSFTKSSDPYSDSSYDVG